MVRALYAAYDGPLYQIRRRADNATLDIATLVPGGFANAAAQDAFCAVPSVLAGLPPFNSTVNLAPVALPAYSFRHCDAQGFVTSTDGNLDHAFRLLPALSGSPDAVSFQSVNFPAWYIAPIAGAEPGRVGLVQTPAAADASWAVAPAAGGAGVTLTSLHGGALAVGGNLTGICAANYVPPAASVYADAGAPAGSTAWSVNAVVPPAPAVCDVWRIYDQSPRGNHLDPAPAGGAAPHPDSPVNAMRLNASVGGHRVFGAYFEGRMGYRIDNTSGVATGNDPETLYMVTSGTHYNDGCCFDYGNAETNNHDDGAGTMECIYFGSWNAAASGWCGGSGAGPWVMADLEDGLWACNASHAVAPANQPLTAPFVTAMVKGGSNGFGLKGGDATATGALATLWEGPRPAGYQPMKKQGALLLGIGGDNSDGAVGTFFEGAVTAGYTSDAADAALQADIVAAGYGK